MEKSDIVKQAIRRFNHLPNRTIARHLLEIHGILWDNDLEKIRSNVRYYRGKHGESNRDNIAEDSLIPFPDKISFPKTWRRPKATYELNPGTWLVLSDAHVPFHELKPIEAALQAGHAEGVTGLLLNGDWQDCAATSYWPTAFRNFNQEVGEVIDSLDFLRQEFPDAEIVYRPGNHEYRLPRAYISKMPELIGSPLTAMETVIGFEERGIQFLDYFCKVMAGKLPILHGHEIRNLHTMVNPARGLFLKTHTWAACSHCHQSSMHTERSLMGDMITTWSFGCLCDLEPDYNPFCNRWSWGFGIINVESDGNFEVINRRVLPNGKVV